jgi:L-threonylcarbamoyladenylate synthase
VPEIAWDIIEMAEEPLTVIYPKGKKVAPSVLAKDGSIAIRLCKDLECLEFLKKMKNGLVSTSANLSGMPSPTKLSEIDTEISNNVDFILAAKSEQNRKSSKIIKLGLDGSFQLIRG